MRIILPDGNTAEVESFENVDLDKEEYFFEGERLTEARAEQIAREVMRRRGLKGGRPPKPAAERASIQKAFRLTPAEADRLARSAKSEGVTEAELVRRALADYLAA